MSNLLSSGVAWLSSQLKSFASSTVTYRRGASSVSLLATIGRHVPQSLGGLADNEVDTFSTVITYEADELDFGSGVTLPERGDEIELVDNGVTFTFEVLPVEGSRWWREADAFGKRIEVAVKLTARS